MECTGAPAVIRDCLGARRPPPASSASPASPSPARRSTSISAASTADMVLDNDVVFGTVNANRRHYEMAADALARADQRWLGRA